MRAFEKFIADCIDDNTSEIKIAGLGCKCNWVHTTKPESVVIRSQWVQFYDHKVMRFIHTNQRDLTRFEKV